MRRFGLLLFSISLILLYCPGVSAESTVRVDLGLIEAAELQKQLDSWILLDARPHDQWRKQHLPGAVSLCWEDYTRTDAAGVPFRSLPPEELAADLGQLGISSSSPVVVYGDADTSWGGEGWLLWQLTLLGHQGPLRLLDGGFQAWNRAGLPLSQERLEGTAEKETRYRLLLRPDVVIDTEELDQFRETYTLIDTRSWWEWLTGHIPDAIHLPWDRFFAGAERRPLALPEYRKLLEECGVSTDRPVVFYCSGGIRSGYAWLVHQLAQAGPARNYEGGLEAWRRERKD